eukprot:g35672.t1
MVNEHIQDIYTIDEIIPMSFRSWLSCVFVVLGTLAVICLATPYFTIVIVPLVVIYYFIQVIDWNMHLLQIFYITTSRQLRRLDSVTRSPIYSHFSETILGLPVIRAYGHQARFLADNKKIMNENQKCVFPWIVANRYPTLPECLLILSLTFMWLAIRLEFLGNLVVFFAALFAVLARDRLDSGLVGLSISYALN